MTAGRAAERRTTKVAESIARDIIREATRLPWGSPLPCEAVMLEHYKVSRSSLREALRVLELQGLITIKPGPGGGPVFVGPDAENLARIHSLHFHVMGTPYSDLMEARIALEPLLVRMAAEREDRTTLERIAPLVQLHDFSDLTDREYLEQSVRYHTAVCSMSGNAVLDMLAQSLQHMSGVLLRGSVFDTSLREQLMAEHAAVVTAILEGDGPGAEHLMLSHLHNCIRGQAQRTKFSLNEVVDWA